MYLRLPFKKKIVFFRQLGKGTCIIYYICSVGSFFNICFSKFGNMTDTTFSGVLTQEFFPNAGLEAVCPLFE